MAKVCMPYGISTGPDQTAHLLTQLFDTAEGIEKAS